MKQTKDSGNLLNSITLKELRTVVYDVRVKPWSHTHYVKFCKLIGGSFSYGRKTPIPLTTVLSLMGIEFVMAILFVHDRPAWKKLMVYGKEKQIAMITGSPLP